MSDRHGSISEFLFDMIILSLFRVVRVDFKISNIAVSVPIEYSTETWVTHVIFILQLLVLIICQNADQYPKRPSMIGGFSQLLSVDLDSRRDCNYWN